MTIHLPHDEASQIYLGNVLNEVLHGFRVDYEKTLGVHKDEVARLFETITRTDAGLIPASGAKLLLNCSSLCLREFDAGEFESRLGEPPAIAQRINESLSTSLDELPVSA